MSKSLLSLKKLNRVENKLMGLVMAHCKKNSITRLLGPLIILGLGWGGYAQVLGAEGGLFGSPSESILPTPVQAAPPSPLVESLPKPTIVNLVGVAGQKEIELALVGHWLLTYDTGYTRVRYLANKKYVFNGKDQVAKYFQSGSWVLSSHKNKWHLNLKGVFHTDRRKGKAFKGDINSHLVLKKLNDKELIVYDAKHAHKPNIKNYEVRYLRAQVRE